MDESTSSNLDVEFKRYLQIMSPYLGQLLDGEAIQLCEAWVQRLSNCSEDEKSLRNKYIFVLCYQLSKGELDEPFLKFPPTDELPFISEITDSESLTELEYLVIDADENNSTKNDNNKDIVETEYQESVKGIDFTGDSEIKNSSKESRRQTILCYTCPEVTQESAQDAQGYQYGFRANNLIMRLRDIKKQNMLLHNELEALKQESKGKLCEQCGVENLPKVETANNFNLKRESSVHINILKTKLQELQEDRQYLLDTLNSVQDQLDNMNDLKKLELEDMEARHKLEIIKIKTSTREETKKVYTKKLEELRKFYDTNTAAIKKDTASKIQSLEEKLEQSLKENERTKEDLTKKSEQRDTFLKEKDTLIEEKDKLLREKDGVIANLKFQLEERNERLQSMLEKILEKPNDEVNAETIKIKAREFEKRLCKMEKSKAKCAKFYENKLAYVEREKHLAECSLQLQLVRQRAQVVNEIAEENQLEMTSALEKLEAKYKAIVATVQSTAIQRRMQDQITLEAILQATSFTRNYSTNHSQLSGKTTTLKHNKDVVEGYESGMSDTVRNKSNMNNNKSFGEESGPGGFCLDGDRLGQLFERVHIPQRDSGEKK